MIPLHLKVTSLAVRPVESMECARMAFAFVRVLMVEAIAKQI